MAGGLGGGEVRGGGSSVQVSSEHSCTSSTLAVLLSGSLVISGQDRIVFRIASVRAPYSCHVRSSCKMRDAWLSLFLHPESLHPR